MDESYDGAAVPQVFELSCLVSSNAGWIFFEMDWLKVLEAKNHELRKQGRKEISRFHAKELNNFKGDFEGWSPDERKEFSIELTKVFSKNPVHIHGWSMPLQLLVREFPETKPNPIGFAYVILLSFIMEQIGETTLELYKRDVISMHHDHCKYDAALQEQFGYMLDDPGFKYRNRFTSLTPEYWQHCTALQPADLFAYENFKESMRAYTGRKRRESLTALIDLEVIGGRSRGFTLEGIRGLKHVVDSMDAEAKRILFSVARIHK
jgi:hypothetical protein